MVFFRDDSRLIMRHECQTLIVEPWNENSLRVRCTLNGAGAENAYSALLPAVEPSDGVVTIELAEDIATIQNGKIKAVIALDTRRFWYLPKAYSLSFFNAVTGAELVHEMCGTILPFARELRYNSDQSIRVEYILSSYDGEKIYGMGQHAHGRLDQKGCLLELKQTNSEINIPFALSNRGYGFLWNNPSAGQAFFGANGTKWVAESTRCLDYWITAGDTPKEIMNAYMAAVGKPPMLPEWAAGFWQCKLRYKTQEELLGVAREYKKRGLPLAVIVIDYCHSKHNGDWSFDPEYFPDPDAMVRELDNMGVKLMVSVWPTVERESVNYLAMQQGGLMVTDRAGVPLRMDTDSPQRYIDPTNAEARAFIWNEIRDNYYRHGIKVWWLDACEPEFFPSDTANQRFAMGDGAQVSNIYPVMIQKAFFDGMRREGEEEIVTLCRSAWIGSQKYGAAVWSGDIPSTFESLQNQVRAGLNMSVSGIPWWTTDIGGFVGGNIDSEDFRELIVRWFQYGVFCPLFRLHGARDSNQAIGEQANEAWSFGDTAYRIIKDLLFLRERLRPYIMQHMQTAHETGISIMRPLFWEYPDDACACEVEDAFLFGPDILVAPVLKQATLGRQVYLPKGDVWQHAWTDAEYEGGVSIEVSAALDEIPVFVKKGSAVKSVFRQYE